MYKLTGNHFFRYFGIPSFIFFLSRSGNEDSTRPNPEKYPKRRFPGAPCLRNAGILFRKIFDRSERRFSLALRTEIFNVGKFYRQIFLGTAYQPGISFARLHFSKRRLRNKSSVSARPNNAGGNQPIHGDDIDFSLSARELRNFPACFFGIHSVELPRIYQYPLSFV